MFRSQECVELVGETIAFATIVGDSQPLMIGSDYLVLLFPEFRTNIHDNGLRVVDKSLIKKQYS